METESKTEVLPVQQVNDFINPFPHPPALLGETRRLLIP